MRRFSRLVVLGCLAASALLAPAACSGGRLVLSDYDTSCTVDRDCVAVYIGGCGPATCACPRGGAINRRDADRYLHDFDDVLHGCFDFGDGAVCGPQPNNPNALDTNWCANEYDGVCRDGRCASQDLGH